MIEIIDDITAPETRDEPASATCECRCSCQESRLDGEAGPVGSNSTTMAGNVRLGNELDING